jgi:outer membrane protein TolC
VAEIEGVDNQRLIVSREAKLIQAERKFLQAAVDLSLYYRNEQGDPHVVSAARLAAFPEPNRPDEHQLDNDLGMALELRPELRYIRLQRQKTSVELNMARNQTLPSLDTGMYAAQDVGQQTPKGDKTPFQLEAGLYFDVPVQRRQAQGQVRAFEAQLAQISAQERYYADRIVADVRFAMTGLVTAYNELMRAREGVVLAERMEQAERDKFAAGNSNILFVNLREQATADTRLLVIDALENFHLAEAEYRAALGADAAGARP